MPILNGILAQPDVDEECETTNASTMYTYGFNITPASHLRIIESFGSIGSEHLRGGIHFVRGTYSQKSDIEIDVRVRSTDEQDLAHVLVSNSADSLKIGYRTGKMKANLCSDIAIRVALRANDYMLLEALSIRTTVLIVELAEGLGWEVNNLFAHTDRGRFYLENAGTQGLIAHNINLSTVEGWIGGTYGLASSLHMESQSGFIGGFVVHNQRLQDFDPKSVSVSSVSGDISLHYLFEALPHQEYTLETKIATVDSLMWLDLLHGSLTNITASGNGSLSAVLMPFMWSSPHVTSEIYTTLNRPVYTSGITVRNPPLVPKLHPLEDTFNPLKYTKSLHRVEVGQFELVYPTLWYGDLRAEIVDGRMDFDGNELSNVHFDGTYVKATRGVGGMSDSVTDIGSGQLQLRVGEDE
jgi:hypothetical protein